ncbi:hypothetical protein Nizo2801_0463 [Lactiplantibacillus plantarum]|nr:hypothetical protein Nizo2263_1320 [Lactiplantibacillus plantarum]KZU55870.1 hypothetical protein Nizo2801_0463 [Lactiplantibacillus plantarum]
MSLFSEYRVGETVPAQPMKMVFFLVRFGECLVSNKVTSIN